MNNKTTFEELFKAGKINIKNSELFNTPVKSKEKIDFGRIEGMILGAAVGDGLGNTSESMQPADRRIKHGEIIDYLADKNGEKKGLPSDDTQFSIWTLEQILKDGSYIPENVAAAFNGKKIFGLGKTVKEFLINCKKGKKWYESGPDSAGNGSLMRISPIILPHLKTNEGNLWIDTALCSMTTHNDSAAIASCLALLNLIWNVMDMDKAPEPLYWLEKFIEILKEFEIREDYNPRCIPNIGYRGTLWGYLDRVVRTAYNEELSVLDACNRWYSGEYLFETVPCVIYILMKHGDNFENAVIRAVNDTKDNDTIAAIVGSVLGALHGRASIPQRWLDNLSGRTGDSDDGRIFEILKSTEKFLI